MAVRNAAVLAQRDEIIDEGTYWEWWATGIMIQSSDPTTGALIELQEGYNVELGLMFSSMLPSFDAWWGYSDYWTYPAEMYPGISEPHGNSKTSMKPQHGYEIYETSSGDVVKTGISGVPLNKNGTSPRANKQVNALNVSEGPDTYRSRVVKTNIPGRAAALEWERTNALRLHQAGHSLRLHDRPRPWE
jgi:hypothetical protein